MLLVVKTTAAAFERLAAAARGIHRYDVPEIIALPIVAGSPDNLDWIAEVIET